MQSTYLFNRTMRTGILVALCLAALSCAKPTPPEKIIEEYYRTLLSGDADGAYAQLSQVERQQVSAENYRAYLAPMFDFSEPTGRRSDAPAAAVEHVAVDGHGGAHDPRDEPVRQ